MNIVIDLDWNFLENNDWILKWSTWEYSFETEKNLQEYKNFINWILSLPYEDKFNIDLNSKIFWELLYKIRILKIFESERIDSSTAIIDLIKALKTWNFSEVAKLAKQNTCQNINNNWYRVYAIIMNALWIDISEKYLKNIADNL